MLTLASLAIAAIASVAAPAVPAPMPAPMHVPDALLAVTSMPEPSGIVFCPALSRYLVISDDTGDKRLGNNHAPWLFAMSPSGQLDSTPLPILGIEKLNDAEAICKGPAGSYLLATSQSKNRKGQDKSARRMLLQLAPSGRALRVLARLDLITAILASGAIPGDSLDIEAMAYRDDALYLGLKSPQTLDGAAIILRIGDFAAALRSGWLDPKKVARWQEVQLRAQGASGEVFVLARLVARAAREQDDFRGTRIARHHLQRDLLLLGGEFSMERNNSEQGKEKRLHGRRDYFW